MARSQRHLQLLLLDVNDLRQAGDGSLGTGGMLAALKWRQGLPASRTEAAAARLFPASHPQPQSNIFQRCAR